MLYVIIYSLGKEVKSIICGPTDVAAKLSQLQTRALEQGESGQAKVWRCSTSVQIVMRDELLPESLSGAQPLLEKTVPLGQPKEDSKQVNESSGETASERRRRLLRNAGGHLKRAGQRAWHELSSLLTESAEPTTDDEFRAWVRDAFSLSFGRAYDQRIADKAADRLLAKFGNDYAEAMAQVRSQFIMEAQINDIEGYRKWAYDWLQRLFQDRFDDKIAAKTVDDLAKRYGEKGNWGAAIGALKAGSYQNESALSVQSLGLKDGLLHILINGQEYGYEADDLESTKKSFEGLLRYSAGRALQWLKKHATHATGGKLDTPVNESLLPDLSSVPMLSQLQVGQVYESARFGRVLISSKGARIHAEQLRSGKTLIIDSLQ